MLTIIIIVILSPYAGLAAGLAMDEEDGLVLMQAVTCLTWTVLLGWAGII